MSFVSLRFLIFLFILLVVYILTPDRHKWKVLLLFSIIFYASSGVEKLFFLISTSLVVDLAAQKLMMFRWEYERSCEQEGVSGQDKGEFLKTYKKSAKKTLLFAIVVCIAILWHCKYAVQMSRLFTKLTGIAFTPTVIVPLGISYYTLSCVGYLADIYWRKIDAERSYPKFLLGMIYFPQIVEGPIARYNWLFPQFERLKRPSYDSLCGGLQLMLWGYLKKLVIADRLSIFVQNVLGNINGNEGFMILTALIFTAFQYYTDFSGCMDIVCGVSEIFGIKLEENFRQPFFSRSIPEFWRRWHITLGSWFKDYVYYPLAMSPHMISFGRWVRGKFGIAAQRAVMTAIPLGFVWLFTGIWHGTGKYYLVWGFYYWGLICASTLLSEPLQKLAVKCHIDTESPWWQYVRTIRTFFLFTGGLLIVEAGGLRKVPFLIRQLFASCNFWIFWDQSLYQHGLDRRNFMLAVLSIFFLLWIEKYQQKESIRKKINRLPIGLRWAIYYLGIFAVLLLGVYGIGYDAAKFVYEAF